MSAAQPLTARGISSASSVSLEKCQTVHAWLTERGDEAVFACAATKLTSGTERLVLVSRYRLLLVRWKFRRAAFRELRLLDLRGITCEGDAGAWGFGDGVTAQIKTPRLQEAARATLKAHALITLCLDVPPLALALPREWGALGFDTEGKEIDMGFSRTWLAVCSYSESKAAGGGVGGGAVGAVTAAAAAVGGGVGGGGAGGGSLSPEQYARRMRVATFMSQLISRPARQDRVLDLTFCAELNSTDFAAAAVALRHTSMFAGLRLYDVNLGDALVAMCECAKTSRTLETLTLSGVLADPGLLKRSPAKALGEALAAGAASGALPLTDLDLSDNELRDAGVIAVGQLIASLKHGLRRLDLSRCHASAKGTSSLLLSMKGAGTRTCASLEALRLGRNEIGVRSTSVLAELLRHAGALQELDLRATGCAVRQVGHALQHGPGVRSLLALHVCGNRLGRADLASLLHLVCASTQLQRLSVSRCGLEPEGVLALLQGMQLNPHLEQVSLDASANPIGTLGAHLLAAALPRLSKLAALVLNDAARTDASFFSSSAAAEDPSASTAVGGAVAGTSVGTILTEALLVDGAPSLTELAIGLNPAPQPTYLVDSLQRLLATSPRLHTLILTGSPTFRLRSELAMLLGGVASAAAGGGAQLSYLDVSSHHAGDALLEVMPPLLTGPGAPATLLMHDNQLSTAGIEQIGQAMGGGDAGACATELLVITHDDARYALGVEVANKRPKEMVARRLQAAVGRVQEAVAANRARRRLYPRIRHPRWDEPGCPARLLAWPNFSDLFREQQPTSPSRLVASGSSKWGHADDADEEHANGQKSASASPDRSATRAQPPAATRVAASELPTFSTDDAFSVNFGNSERDEEDAPAAAPAAAGSGFDAGGSFSASFGEDDQSTIPASTSGSEPPAWSAGFGDNSSFGSTFDADVPPAATESSFAPSTFAASFGDSSFDAPAETAQPSIAQDGAFAASFDASFDASPPAAGTFAASFEPATSFEPTTSFEPAANFEPAASFEPTAPDSFAASFEDTPFDAAPAAAAVTGGESFTPTAASFEQTAAQEGGFTASFDAACASVAAAVPPSVTPDTAAASSSEQAAADDAEWVLGADQVAKYTSLFEKLCAEAGGVSTLDKGNAGLNRSGLPVDTLMKIWALSDLDGDDELNFGEYLICCFLIARCVKKAVLPPDTLPQALISSATAAEFGVDVSFTPASATPTEPVTAALPPITPPPNTPPQLAVAGSATAHTPDAEDADDDSPQLTSAFSTDFVADEGASPGLMRRMSDASNFDDPGISDFSPASAAFSSSFFDTGFDSPNMSNDSPSTPRHAATPPAPDLGVDFGAAFDDVSPATAPSHASDLSDPSPETAPKPGLVRLDTADFAFAAEQTAEAQAAEEEAVRATEAAAAAAKAAEEAAAALVAEEAAAAAKAAEEVATAAKAAEEAAAAAAAEEAAAKEAEMVAAEAKAAEEAAAAAAAAKAAEEAAAALAAAAAAEEAAAKAEAEARAAEEAAATKAAEEAVAAKVEEAAAVPEANGSADDDLSFFGADAPGATAADTTASFASPPFPTAGAFDSGFDFGASPAPTAETPSEVALTFSTDTPPTFDSKFGQDFGQPSEEASSPAVAFASESTSFAFTSDFGGNFDDAFGGAAFDATFSGDAFAASDVTPASASSAPFTPSQGEEQVPAAAFGDSTFDASGAFGDSSDFGASFEMGD